MSRAILIGPSGGGEHADWSVHTTRDLHLALNLQPQWMQNMKKKKKKGILQEINDGFGFRCMKIRTVTSVGCFNTYRWNIINYLVGYGARSDGGSQKQI